MSRVFCDVGEEGDPICWSIRKEKKRTVAFRRTGVAYAVWFHAREGPYTSAIYRG